MKKFLLALALMALAVAPAQSSIVVGTKLSLAIDVSGSISSGEYSLMMQGYQAAFLDAGVQTNILSQSNGIAVNTVFFGTSASANNPWVHLDSQAAITAFANSLGSFPRPDNLGNLTAIALGMNQSRLDLLNNTAFSSNRLVMDVSGDGVDNVSAGGASAVRTARDAAAAAGIRVNGLTIGGGDSLLNYYNNNVRTSDGFVVGANSFADFATAVRNKIFLETQVIPEPGSMLVWLVGMSVLGANSMQRRRVA